MIKLKLPFWLDGPELAKLTDASQQWWELAQAWLGWPLNQMDPMTCSNGILDLLAYQRDIQRFKDEPEELYRKRVKYAYVNARDAGSKVGFERILHRLGLGIGEVMTAERFDSVNWDVIQLRLTNSQVASNNALLMNIIYKYGRTCRRYEFTTLTPIGVELPLWGVGHTWGYSVASI